MVTGGPVSELACVCFKYQYAKEKNNKTEQSSVKLRQPRVCTVFICVKSLWVSHTGLCCHVLEGTPSDSLTRYVHNPLHCAPTPPVLVCYSGFSRWGNLKPWFPWLSGSSWQFGSALAGLCDLSSQAQGRSPLQLGAPSKLYLNHCSYPELLFWLG